MIQDKIGGALMMSNILASIILVQNSSHPIRAVLEFH